MQFPGVTNAWTMPIKARIDMLSTGVRTPVGIKIQGADVKEIERIGTRLESILGPVPGTRSVFAERTAGGYFLDFTLKRENLARYGLTIKEAEMVVQSAVGGEVDLHDGRGPGALHDQRPLRPRVPPRPDQAPPRPGAHDVGRANPVGGVGRHRVRLRPGHAPRRKRNALRLRVRGPGRARRGQLRGRRQEGRASRTWNFPPATP